MGVVASYQPDEDFYRSLPKIGPLGVSDRERQQAEKNHTAVLEAAAASLKAHHANWTASTGMEFKDPAEEEKKAKAQKELDKMVQEYKKEAKPSKDQKGDAEKAPAKDDAEKPTESEKKKDAEKPAKSEEKPKTDDKVSDTKEKSDKKDPESKPEEKKEEVSDQKESKDKETKETKAAD